MAVRDDTDLHHDSKMPTRRAFLTAGAAAVVGSAVQTSAAPAESRVMRLYRVYCQINEEAAEYVPTPGGDEDEEMAVLFWRPRERVIEDMLATPSSSATDFAAKLLADTGHGSYFSDWATGALWREARTLVGEEA